MLPFQCISTWVERTAFVCAAVFVVSLFLGSKPAAGENTWRCQEFIVLQGAWFDDWDTQPSLTYVRNYIGSKHTPRIGPDGCTILVKLCQRLGGLGLARQLAQWSKKFHQGIAEIVNDVNV